MLRPSTALAEEIQQDASADRVAVVAGAGPEEGRRNLWIEDLYREQSPKLLRRILRRTRNLDDARDLLHDIFSKVARLRPSQAAAIEKPEAYLGRMAANILRDEARKSVRRSAELHVVADEATLPGVDQQDLLEKRDVLRRVEAAMLKLKPKTRDIFMAHRVDGLSYAEIAERTGLSIKGVEKQMAKAIAHVDRMLERQSR